MVAIILGYWFGQIIAPILIVGLIFWFIYELIFNFWATIDVVLSCIAVILGCIWDIASWIFMYVWDINLVGPFLAIGGTLFLLRFVVPPVIAILTPIAIGLFYLCLIPIVIVVEAIKKIPNAGIEDIKAANANNATTGSNETTENTTTSN